MSNEDILMSIHDFWKAATDNNYFPSAGSSRLLKSPRKSPHTNFIDSRSSRVESWESEKL
jgi:hypothetical protein